MKNLTFHDLSCLLIDVLLSADYWHHALYLSHIGLGTTGFLECFPCLE